MTLNLDPVFEYVTVNREKFIERLIDYVRRPSISAQGIGIAEVGDYLINFLKQMGFEKFV